MENDKIYVFTDADDDQTVEFLGSELTEKGYSVHIENKRTAKLYFYNVKD